MWLALSLSIALAEVPLPTFRESVTLAAWFQVNDLLEAGHPDEAIAAGERFEREVTEDAGVAYLIGLSHRARGEHELAIAALQRSVRLDANRKDAWSDLGELLLLDKRYAEAGVCFEHVQDQLTTGPMAWLGPFRLAEVAAHTGRPDAFEAHMHEALRRGFSFRTVQRDRNWRAFYQDPALHLSVEKLLTVYADSETQAALRQPEPEAEPTSR